MRLQSIVDKNFKGYGVENVMPLANLTACAERNESRKSRSVNALSAFYEHPFVPVAPLDAFQEVLFRCHPELHLGVAAVQFFQLNPFIA